MDTSHGSCGKRDREPGVEAENWGDVSFSYDFASDTLTYGGRHADFFAGPSLVVGFREHLRESSPASNTADACFAFLFDERSRVENGVFERQLETKDGGERWFSLLYVIMRDADGAPLRALGALRDIDSQKQEQSRLLDKSRTDMMTGLLNKSTTEEEIRATLAHMHLDDCGILFMFDLDNFKVVNDTLGHLAGDSVLIRLARELRQTFRREDIVGRVGGDEFHVFMCDATLEIAQKKARGLCEVIHAMFPEGSLSADLSLSVGIAAAVGPVAYEEIFRQADTALYQAKANGKNRYECYGQVSRSRQGGQAGQGEQHPAVPKRVEHSPAARNSVMVDVIDILFSMYDMRDGIEKTLSFMGNAFQVDKIVILEKSFDMRRISVAHEWTPQPEAATPVCCRDMPAESFRPPALLFSEGVFYCSDTSTLSAEDRAFLCDPDATAVLYRAIISEGAQMGYIGLIARGSSRIWTQQEVDTLTLLSKLVGQHIRQKRAAVLLHENSEATRDILNSLPFALVYVISKENHRIVYLNNTLRRRFPHLRIGGTCHETFWDKSTPCSFCPASRIGGGDSANAILKDTPFGPEVDVAVSSVLWESQEPAYVVFITEHALSDEERERKRKEESFSLAIRTAYDYAADLDPHTGRYEILAMSDPTMNGLPPTGDYTETLAGFNSTHVDPAQRKEYARLFSLENMIASFRAGASQIQMNYRQSGLRGLRWKNRCVYPFVLQNGDTHILTCVRDITEQHEKELRRQRDEANYLGALQSSFTEIYRIDLDNRSVRCVCSDPDLRNESVELLDEHIARKAAACIHPNDRELFTALYAYAELEQHVERGRKFSAEYRRLARNGRYRWVSCLGIPQGGKGRRALILIKDITETKMLAENERIAKRHDHVLRDLYDGVYEIDAAGRRYRTLHRKDSCAALPEEGELDTMIRLVSRELIHADDRDRFLRFLDLDALRLHPGKADGRRIGEFRRRREDGRYAWISLTLSRLASAGSDAEKYLVFLMDISFEKQAEDLARRDIAEEPEAW